MAGKLKRGSQTPFAYRPGTTVLHRAPAALKLLCVMAVSTSACFSLYGLVAAALIIIAASTAARILPWQLLKGSHPLALLSLCVMALNWQTPVQGLLIVLRIFIPFAAAALLFAVTSMRELRLSLQRLTRTVTVPLGIALMLGFIPRFFDLWESANLACDARSCKKSPRRLFMLVPLVTERMMESAADTALALSARSLSLHRD
jgi:energy-coupling factor transporter transmembrane protein EcfT